MAANTKNVKQKTECPECKKMYVNLKEHITKTHTNWTMPENTEKKENGYVFEYKITDNGEDEQCGKGELRHNGKIIEKDVEILHIQDKSYESFVTLPTKCKSKDKRDKHYDGTEPYNRLWLIMDKENNHYRCIQNNGYWGVEETEVKNIKFIEKN